MKGFIVDETYRVEGGKAHVYLFGRLENGESFLTINQFSPYFCIKEEDVERAKKVNTAISFSIETTALKNMQDSPVVKVVLDIPKDVVELRKAFEDKKIVCYEADIRFTQRFLMDYGIYRSMEIEGTYESHTHVNRVYRNPSLLALEWFPTLRILSFDIETSMDGKYLYSISLVCKDGEQSERGKHGENGKERDEVLIVHHEKHGEKKLKKATRFEDERTLLEHFQKEVIAIDPDIITGWNVIDFDLAFLKKKFDHYKIPLRMARQDWDCSLRIESSFLKDSKAEFPGRQVIDGIHAMKLNFIKFEDYKLGTVAEALLGEKKLIGDENKGKDIEDSYHHNPQHLVDYNLKDSQLVLSILEKTNAINIITSRAMLTGMSLERVRGSIASFDSLYLRELQHAGFVGPSGAFAEKEEGIGGGYVRESKPGIYEFIVVLDFKSLYPSIMRTFNIDPLAFERGKSAPKVGHEAQHASDRKNWIVAPNGAVFSNDEGILPQIIDKLWKARDAAKKRKDEHANQAIKVTMNSMFGVLANPTCRFFSMDVANAITSFGRHLLKLTAQKIEQLGYEVIYGDTDSVFVDAHCQNYAQAEKISEEIEKHINSFYATYVKEEYCRDNMIDLEIDKIFIHFLMPKTRGGEEGAKKRYVGILLEDGKEVLDATGIEMVRRDWTELAKEFQMKLLELVFQKENPIEYVKKVVKDLQDGVLDEKLVYRKAIRKELEGYTKTTPPHVKAARKLEEAGIPLTSTLIEYIITTDGPEPMQLWRKHKNKMTIDYAHYIDKQLRPIADSILCFYDASFDDILSGNSQKTLFGY